MSNLKLDILIHEVADSPTLVAIDALLNHYLQKLRVAKNQYQQAGNLNSMLAFEQEIEEVKPKELGEQPEWRKPVNPLIIKKRHGCQTKHTAIVSRTYDRNRDATIALSRGFAEQLNASLMERTKPEKLQKAQAFQASLDELRTVVTIYRQLDKADVEITAWVKETLEYMPERPQPAGGALPKLGTKAKEAGEESKIELSKDVTMTLCWCPAVLLRMGAGATFRFGS